MKSRVDITEPELARLLSGRDELSVLEKERLRSRVLDAAAPEAAPWWRTHFQWASAGALSAVAAGVLALFVLPSVLERAPEGRTSVHGAAEGHRSGGASSSSVMQDEFIARGGGVRAPSLKVECVDSQTVGTCRRGAKIAFSVEAVGQRRYFAAFSQASDGTIFWYFPGPRGHSVEIERARGPHSLDLAIVLDEEPLGSMTVYGVFSDEPMSRERIKQVLGPKLLGDGSVDVLRRTLSIERPQ